jgi:hypothetical protein
MNNKLDKILQSLNQDIKYYLKNKIYNEDYADTIRTKQELLSGKLSNDEIERLYDWLC